MVGMGIFLTGFGANPAITIHYSLFNEHTLGHFRDIQGVGVQVFYALGEIAFVGIAYKFPYWRDLTLYWFTIPIVLLNFGMLIIYESPKFVYSKSKVKGVKILNQIAKVNGLPAINPDEVESNPQNSENNERVYSCIDLFRYASLRWVFVCGLSVFFGIQVVYYGISYASDNIGLDFYINNLIIAICECLAYAMTDSVIIKLKRRIWILAGFIMVGAMAGSYSLMPNDKSWQLV
jgi:OCT family organic cation transporter-like MFS transporter 4/5